MLSGCSAIGAVLVGYNSLLSFFLLVSSVSPSWLLPKFEISDDDSHAGFQDSTLCLARGTERNSGARSCESGLRWTRALA